MSCKNANEFLDEIKNKMGELNGLKNKLTDPLDSIDNKISSLSSQINESDESTNILDDILGTTDNFVNQIPGAADVLNETNECIDLLPDNCSNILENLIDNIVNGIAGIFDNFDLTDSMFDDVSFDNPFQDLLYGLTTLISDYADLINSLDILTLFSDLSNLFDCSSEMEDMDLDELQKYIDEANDIEDFLQIEEGEFETSKMLSKKIKQIEIDTEKIPNVEEIKESIVSSVEENKQIIKENKKELEKNTKEYNETIKQEKQEVLLLPNKYV